ncbi:MAG TPA: hypothetical protein VLH08_14920, partial [Acidobacteriota bacterium]|nr:hypothetical protein [Acidobacteriota bacterium]
MNFTSTNYKYIDQKKTPRKRNLIRNLIVALIALILLAAVTSAVYFFQTRNVEEKILTGKYAEATEELDHWTWLPFLSGRVYEDLGTIQILKQGAHSAQPYFAKASGKPFFRPVGIWIDVLKTLWINGRYADGLAYAQHIERTVSDQSLFRFYKAGFFAGENQLPEASRELQSVANIPELSNEIKLLKSEIEQRTWTGSYAFMIDRENFPLVKMSFKGNVIFLSDAIKPLLVNSEYNLAESLKKTSLKNPAILTLDHRLQNAAQKALEAYAGAIVLLDVKKGDILAAASNLKNHSAGSSIAMTTDYEPGSIIKMI